MEGPTSHPQRAEAKVADFPAGASAVCWVDPDAPQEVCSQARFHGAIIHDLVSGAFCGRRCRNCCSGINGHQGRFPGHCPVLDGLVCCDWIWSVSRETAGNTGLLFFTHAIEHNIPVKDRLGIGKFTEAISNSDMPLPQRFPCQEVP